MKAKSVILGLMMIAAALMSVGAVRTVKPMENTPQTVQLAASQPENARYFLRDCNGFVAVFAGEDDTVPLNMTEIETETLNEVDRELVRVGIPAENKTRLLTLLEDLGS